MRRLARLTRSTAPSNGMDAGRSAGVPLSSPAAAQRGAKAPGLIVALRPQHNRHAVDRDPTHLRPPISINAVSVATSTAVSNLHQLDGRDLREGAQCNRRHHLDDQPNLNVKTYRGTPMTLCSAAVAQGRRSW